MVISPRPSAYGHVRKPEPIEHLKARAGATHVHNPAVLPNVLCAWPAPQLGAYCSTASTRCNVVALSSILRLDVLHMAGRCIQLTTRHHTVNLSTGYDSDITIMTALHVGAYQFVYFCFRYLCASWLRTEKKVGVSRVASSARGGNVHSARSPPPAKTGTDTGHSILHALH